MNEKDEKLATIAFHKLRNVLTSHWEFFRAGIDYGQSMITPEQSFDVTKENDRMVQNFGKPKFQLPEAYTKHGMDKIEGFNIYGQLITEMTQQQLCAVIGNLILEREEEQKRHGRRFRHHSGHKEV